MAHFRATIHGTRGQASRLGSKASGISAACNGWHEGVTVQARVDENGHDVFDISANGGSSGDGLRADIGTVKGGKFYPAKGK